MSGPDGESPRRRGEPPTDLADRTGYQLAKLGEALDGLAERALAPLGLRAKHVLVLTLATRQQLSQQELAELTHLDRTSMVAIVDDLERLGLATRVRSGTDRRRYLIVPTERTEDALHRAADLLDAGEAQLFGTLDAADRATLDRLARHLLAIATGLRG